ncbi:beta-calactosidase [Pochonia chlamydosporia 170]|uniref:Beta-galactosidase n=1 Tax=Pochonia chlamydosporia 170 TaxID=1380566 RepID=A0A179FBI9_METCM|nr:beta-calactosidase [Pochonia chlamydosporia 170]OAQ62479.1 beta-calactosidase [Pochonia chlamydosporia 170]
MVTACLIYSFVAGLLIQVAVAKPSDGSLVKGILEGAIGDSKNILKTVLADVAEAKPKGNFTYNDKEFLLNGKPFQIIGGQIDPQRVPRAYWADRLQKAKGMGLNTIFSYVFWDMLEPVQGHWDFTGANNISAWYGEIHKAGLKAVLRPGPYVCAEHEWGGFPAWLSQVPGMRVRANNRPFLNASTSYIQRLAEQLKTAQITQGGPILMVQVENEYGSYEGDHKYTSALADVFRANFQTRLLTTDGGGKTWLNGGHVPGALAATNGNPHIGLDAINNYVTDPSCKGPFLTGEHYTTWFDGWGGGHHPWDGNDPNTLTDTLEQTKWMLSNNYSFSFYMFHGGTNWGYQSAAKVTTSYDYGAPLDEAGRPNGLYTKLRDLIAEYVPAGSITDIPSSPPLMKVSDFTLTPVMGLFDHLINPTISSSPMTMDAVGQQSGYILYEYKSSAKFSGIVRPGDRPRDRVVVYVNGVKKGVGADVSVTIKPGDELWLFVENLGRDNYESTMGQPGSVLVDQEKGIKGDVTVGGVKINGWNTYSYPLASPPELPPTTSKRSVSESDMPVFYRGSFNTTKSGLAADTFLELTNGTKGVVWINGFNLGRYWKIGPQKQLFVPGAILNSDKPNQVVVLELEPGMSSMVAKGVSSRTWGKV